MSRKRDFKKNGVRAETADTLCGQVPHMTVDELAARLCCESRELCCPACGRIHLTEEDVRKADARLFSETERYKEIATDAEGLHEKINSE